MQTKISRTNQIDINSLHEFHKGNCGYCDGKIKTEERTWITAGFVCPKMGLDIYQSLIDKGWRRCGTYYYKADVDKCCCRPYSIRLDVLKYKIRPSHKKALKKFKKFLNPEEKKQNKEQIQVKNDKIQANKDKIEVEETGDLEFLSFLEGSFKKDFIEFLLHNSNTMKNLINIKDPVKNFTVSEEMLKTIKFLKSTSKKFQINHFLTNFLMVFFAKNKDQFGIGKMKIEEFIEKINVFLTTYLKDYFSNQKYKDFLIKSQLQPNGYIFFELFNEKIKIKQSISQKEAMEEEKEKDSSHLHSKNPKKIQSKLVEEEKKEEPQKEELELRLQKAQFEQESFELYQKYSKIIHQKDKESKNNYKGFLCEQALEYESFKSGFLKIYYIYVIIINIHHQALKIYPVDVII